MQYYRNLSLKTRLIWMYFLSSGSFILFSIVTIHSIGHLTGSNYTIQFGLGIIAINLILIFAFLSLMRSFTGSINGLKKVMAESASGGIPKKAEIIGQNEITDMALHYNVLVEELNRQMWRKDGLNNLSNMLAGSRSILDVCQKSIAYVSGYTRSGHGVFYLYQPEKEELELMADFAGSGSNFAPIKLGHGIIGQTALERKPILVSRITEAEADVFSFPLIFEKEIYGVIELSSYEPFTDEIQAFLKGAARIISTNLYATVQNEKIRTLFDQSEIARKRAEELADRLRRQSEELQAANSQLELASGYKTQFLANMSHELRTPLNSIILLSKIMLERKNSILSTADLKRVSVINGAGNDLLSLINDILDISKIESGKVELKPSHFGTGEFLSSMGEFFIAFAAEINIDFEIIDEINANLFVDREKLTRIIRNFLSNSFKFTKKGQVSLEMIHTGQDDYPAAVVVKDTGIGIPGEELKNIFEAFKQVDESISRKYGGTGLGLYICRQLAEKIGARIEAKSTLGVGSEFRLFLPAERVSLDGAACKESSVSHPRPLTLSEVSMAESHEIIPAVDFTEKNILIVDDDPKNIFVLASALEEYGAKILGAVNCEEALGKLTVSEVDLILMDMMIGGESGYECMMKIKSQRRLQKIPIIAVTARALIGDREKCLAAGADDYISKPVDYLTLIQSANTWMTKE